MSARQIAQLGLVLLGVYLIVNALAHGVSSLTARPLLVFEKNAAVPDLINSMVTSTAIGLIGATIFGVLPGAILILKSQSWASSWFPESPTFSEIPARILLQVGLLLLGIDFVVSGFSGVVGGIAQVASSDTSDRFFSYGWGNLSGSMIYLIAGLALVVAGRRLGRSTAA